MRWNEKQTGGYRRIVFVSLLISAASGLLLSCNRYDGPYVELKGHKYTEKDLKNNDLKRYRAIRSKYESDIKDALEQYVTQKMLEMEAKEQNLSESAYMQKVYARAHTPDESELKSFYDRLKSGGQVQDSFPAIKDRLQDYMTRQYQQMAMSEEISRLKQKYDYHLPTVEIDTKGEPVRNNPNGKVEIVEFSDFECPFCLRAQTVNHQIREKYGDKIRWVFKDFPLSFHPHAMGAHIAANCVLRLDEKDYWKYFDHLFDPARDEKTLSPEGLEAAALSLGIDRDKFEACLKDPAIKAEIQEDIEEGQSLGVNGTPAFFVNGKMVSGAVPFEEFDRVVSESL